MAASASAAEEEARSKPRAELIRRAPARHSCSSHFCPVCARASCFLSIISASRTGIELNTLKMARFYRASLAVLPLFLVLASSHNAIEMKIISDLLATESRLVRDIFNLLS